MHSIIDLHCDLLCYLANDPSRSALDSEVRCSLPQLREGHVQLQTMAIFTETEPGSTKKGKAQIAQFELLPKKFPQDFQILKKDDSLEQIFANDKIKILMAIENASGFFEEDEPLETGFNRIAIAENNCGKILYTSFTWNFENRFGGGAHTKIGLKNDGQQLLDFLNNKRIAVDLSHASDPLAYDILDYIDKKNLQIPVMASHSNFRTITNVSRNLPDEIASEILRRQGLIGFVLYRDFIGAEDPFNIVRQMEHVMKLGGEKQICFGADFFSGNDLPPAFKKPVDQLFFAYYGNATKYHSILSLWQKHLGMTSELLEDIAYRNFIRFYTQRL